MPSTFLASLVRTVWTITAMMKDKEVTVRGMFAHVYGSDGACGEGGGDGAHVVLGGANEVNESLY